jgi:hypothetical protein
MSVYLHLPAGVEHMTTSGTAKTWKAYDALTEEAGWRERSWEVEAYGPPMPTPAHLHTQKEAQIDDCRVVVFPPRETRP